MALVWHWQFKDKYDRTHKRVTRGPQTVGEMMSVAKQLLVVETDKAVDSGAPDPELVVTEMKTVGEDDSPVGVWLPAGSKAVDLSEFEKGRDNPPVAVPAAAKPE
jgi:hypothetical protein